MPELMVLIKGILIASRSVVLTLVLLVMIIYVFSIAFRQLTHGTNVGTQFFPNVPSSMATLLLKGTLPDQGPWVEMIGGESLVFGFCVLMYVILTTILLMNMLLGILVEVVKCVSVVEKETLLVNHVRDRLRAVFEEIDEDFDGNITKGEFEVLMAQPQATQALRDVGVDAVGLIDRADALFADVEDISFGHFLDQVMNLRGNNTAKVNDILDLRKTIIAELRQDVQNLQYAMSLDREEMQNLQKMAAENIKSSQAAQQAPAGSPAGARATRVQDESSRLTSMKSSLGSKVGWSPWQ